MAKKTVQDPSIEKTKLITDLIKDGICMVGCIVLFWLLLNLC